MIANPILLQRKYVRIIERFADEASMSLDDALDFFYRSKTYELMSKGIADTHCMSDIYIIEDLLEEYYGKYFETLKTIPEPISVSNAPKVKIKTREMFAYAAKHGKKVSDLTVEELSMFIKK